MICLLVGLEAAVQGKVILAGDGLAIEDEEGDDVEFLPVVEVLVNVRLDASQTAKGGEERFLGRRVVEKLAEVVGRINGDGTLFELGNIVRAT